MNDMPALSGIDSNTSSSPKSVLFVVAHPDDIEFCSGGSVAQWIKNGTEVSYLILTDGSIGTTDPAASGHEIAAIRQEEQRAAAQLLGVKNVSFCDYQDASLTVTSDVKRDIVRAMRKVRPDTVVTLDPTMVYSISRGNINHTDHRAAGQATLDAVFPLARDRLAFPELFEKEKLEPHKVATVLLINYDTANFWVDITATMQDKLAALAKHKSQFSDMATVESMVRDYARTAGAKANYEYAEAYIRLDIPKF